MALYLCPYTVLLSFAKQKCKLLDVIKLLNLLQNQRIDMCCHININKYLLYINWSILNLKKKLKKYNRNKGLARLKLLTENNEDRAVMHYNSYLV